jgi:hypothetical protein
VKFGVEIMTVISTHYVYNVVAISRCKHGDGANLLRLYSMRLMLKGSRDSSVGIATSWMVRESNHGGGRDFPHLSRPALGPT